MMMAMTNSQKAQAAKNWLNRNFGLSRQLRSLYRRRMSQTFANISQYEEGFSETVGNRSEAKMLSFAELNQKIEDLERKLLRGDTETKEAIDHVENPLFWSLLRDRYVDRKGWRQIAKSYGYSEQHIFRIHGQALLEIYPFIPEEVREHD